mmetsp:Transcript_5443/g.5933  ORF Transcript_5443/g.5933 Transcript_5443/m.5933 type:complete len:125 (-) Transcript_5443:166-540(-)
MEPERRIRSSSRRRPESVLGEWGASDLQALKRQRRKLNRENVILKEEYARLKAEGESLERRLNRKAQHLKELEDLRDQSQSLRQEQMHMVATANRLKEQQKMLKREIKVKQEWLKRRNVSANVN